MTLPSSPAGFWRRFAALILDTLLVAVLNIPFLLVPSAQWIVGLLLWLLYYPFFNSSALQGTPGKVYLGMAIEAAGGGRISFRAALIREVAELISALLLGFGYLMSLFTERRRTLHDLIADTVVVRRPVPDQIDLWGAWKSEFQRVLRLSSSARAPVPPLTPPPLAPVPPSPSLPLADLEALHRLRVAGALTEEEYQRKKTEILARV